MIETPDALKRVKEPAPTHCIACPEPIQQNRGKNRRYCESCAEDRHRDLSRERATRRRRQSGIHARFSEYAKWKARRDAMPRPDMPEAELVLNFVCEQHGIARELLLSGGKNKARALAWARAEAAYRLRHLIPEPSYPVVAKLLGLKDHTSALLAVRRYAARVEAVS